MTFLHPTALFLFCLLPFWFWWMRRRVFAHAWLTPDVEMNGQSRRLSVVEKVFAWLPEVVRMLTLAFLIVALARPIGAREPRKEHREGVDLMLVVDTSDSMQALDFEIAGERRNRLTVAVAVLQDFVTRRPDDRIGLVVFGREAFLQCPLTLDHGMIQNFLGRVRIGMADGKGTAIGEGLGVGLKRLRAGETKSRVAILLTDGDNNAGSIDPTTATQLAKELGVRVYTIGVGSKGEVPVPVQTAFGTRLVYQRFELDEELLTQIATETGGKYFRATETEELQKIYRSIDELEKSKLQSTALPRYEEEFSGFLYLVFAWLALEGLLAMSKWRRMPV